MINPHIVRKTTNPTSAPPEAGIHWINTITNEEYFSVGTATINDWLKRGTITYADALQTSCYNNTGSTIPAFSVVYINGSQGNLPTIALSQANNEANSSKTYGVTTSSIANNQQGTVIAFGLLQNVATNSYPQGSALWLSPDVAGGVTTTKPSAPNHMVFIGNVTRSHPTLGRVEVKIQNGFEIEELHNVSAQSPLDGDVIRFNSVSGLWENNDLSDKVSEDQIALSGTVFVSPNASSIGENGSLLKPYSNISNALDNASNGDTIFLLNGTYNEPLVEIPSSLNTLSIVAQSQNGVTISNGVSYVAGSASISLSFEKINLGLFNIDLTSAINGVVNLHKCGLSFVRSDNNTDILLIASECNFFGGQISGGTNNLTECLIISQITANGGLVITENCKYVSNFDCYGSVSLRVLDCELFGAGSFMIGNVVGLNTPALQIDTASDYFGSFSGVANKTLLANFGSFPFSYPLSTENVTIAQDHLDNKRIVLLKAPVNPESVTFLFQSGIHQINGLDFSVIGNEVTWDGLGLDGFIEIGDVVIIQY